MYNVIRTIKARVRKHPLFFAPKVHRTLKIEQ